MDIAAMSMGLSQMKLANEVSTSVMKMAMESGQTKMDDMLRIVQDNTKMLEQSVSPNLGANLDIKF